MLQQRRKHSILPAWIKPECNQTFADVMEVGMKLAIQQDTGHAGVSEFHVSTA